MNDVRNHGPAERNPFRTGKLLDWGMSRMSRIDWLKLLGCLFQPASAWGTRYECGPYLPTAAALQTQKPTQRPAAGRNRPDRTARRHHKKEGEEPCGRARVAPLTGVTGH